MQSQPAGTAELPGRVTTGTGIIKVATANNPSLLDPAILRRPGRFDRVVLFSNPSLELPQDYFANSHPAFAGVDLFEAVAFSEGFSSRALELITGLSLSASAVKQQITQTLFVDLFMDCPNCIYC